MPTVGFIAAAGFVFVSAAANLRFGISLASTPFDRVIYGTLSLAADLMKIALPLMVMILWRKGERIFAIAGAVFWIGAVAYSVSAALGFAVASRSQTYAYQDSLIESRKAWEAKIIRIESQLERLGTPRPSDVVNAEIDNLLKTPGTEGCKLINGPVTKEICPKVGRLERELAASKEVARLEVDLVANREALSKMPDMVLVADPQSAALHRIPGIDEETIRIAIGMTIAILVELGSALGFTLLILASDRAGLVQTENRLVKEQQPPPQPETRLKSTKQTNLKLSNTPEDLVACWALDRLDIVSSGTIQAEHAYQDFRRWCLANDKQLLTAQMFGRRFTKVHAKMGGRKVKRRCRSYYEGAVLQTDQRSQSSLIAVENVCPD